MLQTEYPFTLPRGYVDENGELHRDGVMRLATAFDEIGPLKDPRVMGNPGYLVVILLSRVITRLGSLDQVNPRVIEGLFAADFTYLQNLYRRINEPEGNTQTVVCPKCEYELAVEVGPAGELSATPRT
jgi:hypothetical protein